MKGLELVINLLMIPVRIVFWIFVSVMKVLLGDKHG